MENVEELPYKSYEKFVGTVIGFLIFWILIGIVIVPILSNAVWVVAGTAVLAVIFVIYVWVWWNLEVEE